MLATAALVKGDALPDDPLEGQAKCSAKSKGKEKVVDARPDRSNLLAHLCTAR